MRLTVLGPVEMWPVLWNVCSGMNPSWGPELTVRLLNNEGTGCFVLREGGNLS